MTIVRFMPDDKRIDARAGTTLLDVGRRAGIPIRTRCGAMAACLMCKVKLDDQSGLQPPGRIEQLKLGEELLGSGIRLACQTKLKQLTTGEVLVHVPEDPLRAAIRAQLARQKEEDELW